MPCTVRDFARVWSYFIGYFKLFGRDLIELKIPKEKCVLAYPVGTFASKPMILTEEEKELPQPFLIEAVVAGDFHNEWIVNRYTVDSPKGTYKKSIITPILNHPESLFKSSLEIDGDGKIDFDTRHYWDEDDLENIDFPTWYSRFRKDNRMSILNRLMRATTDCFCDYVHMEFLYRWFNAQLYYGVTLENFVDKVYVFNRLGKINKAAWEEKGRIVDINGREVQPYTDNINIFLHSGEIHSSHVAIKENKPVFLIDNETVCELSDVVAIQLKDGYSRKRVEDALKREEKSELLTPSSIFKKR